MTTIFISYRQNDSPGDCRQLSERLKESFGRENVFLDIDDLKPGQNWWKVAREKIPASDVVLVPVGQNWVTIANRKGMRRLDDPNDPIRMEIGLALKENIRIIPLLVEQARMPDAEQLPVALREFADFVAHELRHGHFLRDVDLLIEMLGGEMPDAGAPASGVDDLLATFGKSFAAKLGERLAGGGASSPARPPVTSYAPPPQLQLNLTGTWQSPNGLQHSIWQQANVVRIESRNQYGMVVIRGQGQIAGNQVHIIYDAQYQPPYVTRGEARFTATPDGMFISGQTMDAVSGMQPVQMRRIG